MFYFFFFTDVRISYIILFHFFFCQIFFLIFLYILSGSRYLQTPYLHFFPFIYYPIYSTYFLSYMIVPVYMFAFVFLCGYIYIYIYIYVGRSKSSKLHPERRIELNIFVLTTQYHIYPPLRSGRIWHKVNFKRSLTGLNLEFSFS